MSLYVAIHARVYVFCHGRPISAIDCCGGKRVHETCVWVGRNVYNWCSCRHVCGYVVYMYNWVHHPLLLQLAGSLSAYVDSCVLLCVVEDRFSISIKQRGVLYIYNICSSKHLSLVLCRYMSLFMRVCVHSISLYIYVDARQ